MAVFSANFPLYGDMSRRVMGILPTYSPQQEIYSIGVKTTFNFTRLSESWVLKQMTIVGLRLQKDLKGIPSIDMETEEKKQFISTTGSF